MALTKAHHRMIEGASLNVKDFGAVGDGVADDTAAILACLNAAPLGAGVYFPGGDYKITDTLDMTGLERMTLFGDSWRGSNIRQATVDKTALKLPDTNNMIIKDLGFYGQNANTTGWGIDTGGCARLSINRCMIEGWGYFGSGGGGIYVKDTIVLDVIDCQIGSCYYGIYNEAPTIRSWNGGTVAGCYISSIIEEGFYAYGLNGVSFSGTTFESCFGGGVRIDVAGGGLSFAGCYFEANQTDGGSDEYHDIYIGSSSYINGISITGCYFNGVAPHTTDYYPVRIKYANGIFMEGNLLNTDDKFVKFDNGAIVTDIHLGTCIKEGVGGQSYSDTDTYANLPENFYSPQNNNYNHYRNTFIPTQDKQRSGSIPCTIDTWTTAVTGTGAVTSQGTGIVVSSEATAGSTAIASTVFAPSLGQAQANYDFAKDSEIEFIVSNIASGTTNGQTWLRLSNSISAADPGARAFGFRIDGNAIKGILCRTDGTLFVLDLSTNISDGIATSLKVVNNISTVSFFVNGVLKGSQSAGINLSGVVATSLVLSVTNGADSATQRIGVYDIKYRVNQ